MSNYASATVRISAVTEDETLRNNLAAQLFNQLHSISGDTTLSPDAVITILPICIEGWTDIVGKFSADTGCVLKCNYYAPDGDFGHSIEATVENGEIAVTYDSHCDARIFWDEYAMGEEEMPEYEERLFQLDEYDWDKKHPENYAKTVLICSLNGTMPTYLFDVSDSDSFYDASAKKMYDGAFLLFLARQNKYPRLSRATEEAVFTENASDYHDLYGQSRTKEDYEAGYIIKVFGISEP